MLFLGESEGGRRKNDTALGVVDFALIQNEFDTSNRRSTKYMKYTDNDRYNIGKYAYEFGNSHAARHFKKAFPSITESSVRTFKKKYEDQLATAKKAGVAPVKSIVKKKLGRPLLLGQFDSMIQKYIQSMSNRGAVITWSIANSVAKALMRKYPGIIADIDIDSSSWAQSLFRRMGFVKRRKNIE